MIKLFYTLFLLSSFCYSQNCKEYITEDKFTKEKQNKIYIDGDYSTPYIILTVKIRNSNQKHIEIQMQAGDGKKDSYGFPNYDNLTLKYVDKDNAQQLYFLFDDSKSFLVSSPGNIKYGQSVYIVESENPELFMHLKNNNLTDIRFVFNYIKGDYSINKTYKQNHISQDYFKILFSCLNW